MKSLPWSSRTRSSGLCLLPSIALLAGALGCLCTISLQAQTLTFTGATPFVDFGSANLCKPGQAKPPPCSKSEILTYRITAGGSLGTPKVLTAGSPGLDFILASGSTCEGSVTEDHTCTVIVTFTPRLAGGRPGAVQITDESGKVLTTTLIYGSGTGPQIATLTQGVAASLPFIFTEDSVEFQFTADGAGDVFGFEGTLYELPANGGPQITLYTDPNVDDVSAGGEAIDGAGNLIFANNYSVTEVPADGVPFTYTGLTNARLVAVDGAGDVFALDDTPTKPKVLKFPLGCHSEGCATIVAQYDSFYGIATDVAGDLFVAYYENSSQEELLAKIPAGGNPPTILISGITIYAMVADGVGNLIFLNDQGVRELFSGTTSPVTLADVGDYGESYSFGTDLSGDLFAYTSFHDGDPFTDYAGVTYVNQFAPLNFGSLPVGTAKVLPLAITNTGNANLIVSPYLESPSYKIVSQNPAYCLGGTLPGRTCNVNIQFTALTDGPHTITLTLGSNGASDSTVLLEGTGTK